jgi:CBS domain-containing protein
VIAEAKSPASVSVGEVASGDPVTVGPEDLLDDARQVMATEQIRRLLVVDDEERLVGVLAQADVARNSAAFATGEVVEAISRPELASPLSQAPNTAE